MSTETNNELISRNIIRDMSDGVVIIGLDGVISHVNSSAERILEKSANELVGKKFARCFFEFEENDSFNQCVLNTIYEKSVSSNKVITDFYTGKAVKKLYLTTSYTQDDDGNRIGIILILDDITQTIQLQDRLFKNQLGTIMMMAELVESRDGNTGGHIKRTAEYVRIITHQLLEDSKYPETITPDYERDTATAAPLHDVGKIMIDENILHKPGRFTDEEYKIMQQHVVYGGKLLEGVPGNIMQLGAIIALYHHERWDGNGYANGLKGNEIPREAQITSVADVFDALVSKRCYKGAWTIDEAYNEIVSQSGKQFSLEAVEAFKKRFEDFKHIAEIYKDEE